MITDETSLFDVLGDFFYHSDERVRAAALEVYVRRAFTSYDVIGLNNLELSGKKSAVKFDFLLPQSHPNRSFQSISSGESLIYYSNNKNVKEVMDNTLKDSSILSEYSSF